MAFHQELAEFNPYAGLRKRGGADSSKSTRSRVASGGAARRTKSNGTSAKKTLAADDITVRHVVGLLEAELNKRGKDVMSPLTRLSRLIQRQDSSKHSNFVRQTKGGDLLLRIVTGNHHEAVLLSAVQSLTCICGSSKAAVRLAKNGAGPLVVKAILARKSIKDPEIHIGLYACLSAIAPHDVHTVAGHSFAPQAFQSYDCASVTVAFVKRNIGKASTILPALRAMLALTNEFSACTLVEAKAFSVGVSVVQRFSTHIKFHGILRVVLRMLNKLVRYEQLAESIYRSGVKKLLEVLVTWVKLDARRKHDSVRREVFAVLTRMMAHEQGRRAFLECGGVTLILEAISGTEAGSSLPSKSDSFLSSCVALLRKCRPFQPLPTVPAPLSFALPEVLVGTDADEYAAESDEEEDMSIPAILSHPELNAEEAAEFADYDDDGDLENFEDAKDSAGDSSDDQIDAATEFVQSSGSILPVDLAIDQDCSETTLDVLSEVQTGNVSSEPLTREANWDRSSQDDGLSDDGSLGTMSGHSICGSHVVFDEIGDTVIDDIEDTIASGSEAECDEIEDHSRPTEPNPVVSPPSTFSFGSRFQCDLGTSPISEALDTPPPSPDMPTDAWEDGRESEISEMERFFPELDVGRFFCTTENDYDVGSAVDHPVCTVRGVVPPLVPSSVFCAAGRNTDEREPLLRYHSKKTLRRKLLFDDMEILSSVRNVRDRIIYDVDKPDLQLPSNAAGLRIPCLQFDSRFESGNLRQASQVHDTLYDLVLSPDINSEGHTQWFYFSVTGMVPGVRYRFNIVNLEKSNSQFNFGMQPVMLSTKEVEQGGGWRRVGTRICYHKNGFRRKNVRKVPKSYHFSATFSITFRIPGDTCYIAYHYPYTYTDSQAHLDAIAKANPHCVKRQLLCKTLGGNRCDLLTVTSSEEDDEELIPIESRRYVVLSGRVHPGESNASWMMKGLLDFLVGDSIDAKKLRRQFIFKIIPMLNPDGVANGNHRCSLAGCDLNRRWRNPHAVLHPTVYKTRLLLSYLKAAGVTPELYCDFHGHSRRKMVFMYGCSESPEVKLFPRVLDEATPEFSLKSCSFNVTADKEGSARVVVWRSYGVVRSYTIEATFCGFDRGAYHGDHICRQDLRNVGKGFARQLLRLDP